jgi:hypothetical protein
VGMRGVGEAAGMRELAVQSKKKAGRHWNELQDMDQPGPKAEGTSSVGARSSASNAVTSIRKDFCIRKILAAGWILITTVYSAKKKVVQSCIDFSRLVSIVEQAEEGRNDKLCGWDGTCGVGLKL